MSDKNKLQSNSLKEFPKVIWVDSGINHSAPWRSESSLLPPKKILLVDDSIKADRAYRLMCEGTALLWQGDFQNARQMLQAVTRRLDRNLMKEARLVSSSEKFNRKRQIAAQRAFILGRLIVQFDKNNKIPLRRSPDVSEACEEVYGPDSVGFVMSLREILGVIGAHEWRKKGVFIPALEDYIFPHYGVFSPVRGEYLSLLNQAPLPSKNLAFDIGTGTGVIAAILVKRGVKKIVATEIDHRSLRCARANFEKLGFSNKIDLRETDLFPQEKSPLIICNPPWIPARPNSPIEHAIYDLESRMLKGFLDGLKARLKEGGEGWLILSDIAVHLGLRTKDEVLSLITAGGLKVVDRMDIRPKHPKSRDQSDFLFEARAKEITSLWRLGI